MHSTVRLALLVEEEALPRFCLLTGGGFMVGVDTNLSIQELLCGKLSVPAEYVERRIQTIFLDGKPVDDPKAAGVRPGSTVALSAAMPGIAGIMLRRGSPYAPMRSQISHAEQDSKDTVNCQGDVVVRLFNSVQTEMGPVLLGRGVRITGKSLANLFRGREKALAAGIITAQWDGEAISPHDIFATDWQDRGVFLQVRA